MQCPAHIVVTTLMWLWLCGLQVQAQKKRQLPGFLNGYALNGHDTIRCRLAFNHSFPYPDRTSDITLDLDGEMMTFAAADGLITGFGVEDGGKLFEYGIILDAVPGRKKSGFYAKKLVAGSIDLYEYMVDTKIYNPIAGSSKTAPDASVANAGNNPAYKYSTSTKQNSSTAQYTTTSTKKVYFIGKYDPNALAFTNPVKLPALKKEWLAPFISDYPALLETIPEKFTKKELTRMIQEYNYWRLKQKK